MNKMAIFSSPFKKNKFEEADVYFVADFFPEDYVGGAELTIQALIDSAPVGIKVKKYKCSELTSDILNGISRTGKKIVFGNWTGLHPDALKYIAQNMKYQVVECDYKFCKHRSPEKHETYEGMCDCHETPHGQIAFAFLMGSEKIWWMSDKQRQRHESLMRDLIDSAGEVLSSVFDTKTLNKLKELSFTPKDDRWAILKSDSWIKGTDENRKYCIDNNLPFIELGNMPYDELLKTLAGCKGLVYMPLGGDTCPRLVIEAKILGCELVLNDNVEHAREWWFDGYDGEEIGDYLRTSPDTFWKDVLRTRTLSGYTTVYNCIDQKYPYLQCVKSMLEFCDEVIVVDGGSTDGTLEELLKLKSNKLVVQQKVRDLSDPEFALFDGMQKAYARQMCTSDFCIQLDSDEIVHENDYQKYRNLIEHFPKGTALVSLPVIEYWGGYDKVRLDVTPWKWRVSKNSPRITHGVPKHLQSMTEDGHKCALGSTDGCDMIDQHTAEPVKHIGFYSDRADSLRTAALQGDQNALESYTHWLEDVIKNVPGVFHYSWFDIRRKIGTYGCTDGTFKWTKHWESLFGKKYVDNAESNMFFDKPWSEVTSEDMDLLAERLKNETGGHIWHSKWKGQRTPHITLRIKPPTIMEETK